MAWMAKDSAISVTDDVRKALENASVEQMKDILHDAAIRQALVVPDSMNPDVLIPTELSTHANNRVKQVTINSKTYEISGSSEEELVAAELQLFREVIHPQSAQQEQPVAQRRNPNGTFTAGDQQTSDAAIEDYLQRNNIDLSEVRDRRYVTDWESAGNEFMQRHPEWAGGQENMTAIGNAVMALGLQDEPSADALERAYAELQRRGQYRSDTAEARAARAAQQISGAMDHESIRSLGRSALGIGGFFER
jgi:hypothetical protein